MSFESPERFKKREPEKQKFESNYSISIKDLPVLKKDHVRLVHITSPETIERIVRSGLNYESQGMISSTAQAYSQASDVEYGSNDPRFNQNGMKVVIMDVPIDEYRLHNDLVKSPGVIPSNYIVGIVDVKKN